MVEPDPAEQSAVGAWLERWGNRITGSDIRRVEASAEAVAELPPSVVETDPDGGSAGHAR